MGTVRYAAVVALAFILAGCLSEPKPVCQTDCTASTASSTAMITRPSDVPLPPIPLNESLRSYRQENCTGFGGNIVIPTENARKAIPAGFSVYPNIVPGTAIIFFRALECERLVLPEAFVPDFLDLWFGIRVLPKNQSWAPDDGAIFYELAHYIREGPAIEAFASWGIPAKAATFTVTSPASGADTTIGWQVEASDGRFQFSYAHDTNSGTSSHLVNYNFVGPDPYLRTTKNSNHTISLAMQDGTILVDGANPVAAAMGSLVGDWYGTLYLSRSEDATLNPALYFGDKK